MPIYEYQCQDCGSRSEELQRVNDDPLTICPSCGGVYKRLLSAPAFQFKGSGWYVTDYARKGGEKGDEKADKSGDGKEAEKKAGGKADGSKAEKAAGKTEKAATSSEKDGASSSTS